MTSPSMQKATGCVEAWVENGGRPGRRVAYLHWLYRCGPRPDRRRQFVYFLLGYAVRSRFIHGNGRFPMTDGRRGELSARLAGKAEITLGREAAEQWVREGSVTAAIAKKAAS